MGIFSNRSPRQPGKGRKNWNHIAAARLEPLESRQLLSVSVAEPEGDAFLVNTTTATYQYTSWRGQSVDSDADGDSVVVWHGHGPDGSWGVYGQRYDQDGNKAGSEFRVNTTQNGSSQDPSVAVSDSGDFVVTWMAYNYDGSQNYWDVYAQRYAADGSKQGGEFRVNTTTIHDDMYSNVAMDADGDFVVSWNGMFLNANNQGYWGVFTQRYAADGTPRGIEVRVDDSADGTNRQWDANVAMDAAGNYVVAWSDWEYNGSRWEGHILALRYAADGTQEGGQIYVSDDPDNVGTYEHTYREYVDVAADDSGNFVVTWSRHNYDGTNNSTYWDVLARRYDANGNPAGSHFRVNTTTVNQQIRSSVDADADGDFAITWEGHDSSGRYGVQFQQYDSDGTKVGGEVTASQHPGNGEAIYATVAVDDAGDIFVAWSEYRYTYDSTYGYYNYDYDVYARRYTVHTNSAPALTALSTNAAQVGAVSEGLNVVLVAAFIDPDDDDARTAVINWGDGSTSAGTVNDLARTVAASHPYASGGLYNITLTVTDSEGEATSSSTHVNVTGSGVHNGVLHVVGTAGNDRVDVLPKNGLVRAGAGFLPGFYRFYDPATINKLFLAGGPGNDELWAGQKSLLIGGTGADKVNGANGDDIAVASSTSFDTNLPALLAALANPLALVGNVFDDGAADVLCGNKGTDSFFGKFQGDGVIDTINDVYRRPEEAVFEIGLV
jgi:hypothetical protein